MAYIDNDQFNLDHNAIGLLNDNFKPIFYQKKFNMKYLYSRFRTKELLQLTNKNIIINTNTSIALNNSNLRYVSSKWLFFPLYPVITCDSNYIYSFSGYRLEKYNLSLYTVLTDCIFEPFIYCANCIYCSNFDEYLYICKGSDIFILTKNFHYVATHELRCLDVLKIRIINDVASVYCVANDTTHKLRFYRLPNFEFICEYNILAPAIAVYQKHFYVYTNTHFICFDCNGNFVQSREVQIGNALDMIFVDDDELLVCIEKSQYLVKIKFN
jgi:hypothetical protein